MKILIFKPHVLCLSFSPIFAIFAKKYTYLVVFIFSLFAKITIWCSYLFLILVSHLHLAFHFERRKWQVNGMIGLDWVRNFMFRGKSGFSRSGQHKFLGLVRSKSGSKMQKKNHLYLGKMRSQWVTQILSNMCCRVRLGSVSYFGQDLTQP